MRIPSTVSRIGIPFLTALAGFGLAHTFTPSPPAEELMRRLDQQDARMEALARRLEASAASVSGVPAPQARVGMDLSGLRVELRQMLREELSTAVASADDDRLPEKEQAPPPPTPENMAAYEKAHRLVEDRLSAGSWGRAQIHELRTLRGQMSASQYMELVRKLLTAFNNQQLRLEEPGSPI
ncbi:hypothetical protein HPC49_09830 [Pyxidicoccus fallax]|uniref:Uncharacterized protein n=1 Tax=Pyxidicoccus fallax TaxID=394095 RepID=A0A848L4W5_9BACT|nr:hypothetical protein [Pyxidicoccus fallax]NMO13507.1 hypothetical protein [Pyxidicoccus fallax]NPC78542.1 hypothetical protein [Pyxidicoccus fallax]